MALWLRMASERMECRESLEPDLLPLLMRVHQESQERLRRQMQRSEMWHVYALRQVWHAWRQAASRRIIPLPLRLRPDVARRLLASAFARFLIRRAGRVAIEWIFNIPVATTLRIHDTVFAPWPGPWQ